MNEYSITNPNLKRFRLIGCEVLQREFFFCAAKAKTVIDIEFCSQGYHDLECSDMCSRLQEKIDKAEGKGYDAILLGFALCSNGILGLTAGKTPIVIPRAHDCITLLLGSKERYSQLFFSNPGTYYLSSGWIERDAKNLEDLRSASVSSKLGIDKSLEELIKEYGEENAQYIIETLSASMKTNYTTLAFIDTGLGNVASYRSITIAEAKKRSLEYKEIQGDLTLIQKLLDGAWNDNDFLILENGKKIERDDENQIIKAV